MGSGLSVHHGGALAYVEECSREGVKKIDLLQTAGIYTSNSLEKARRVPLETWVLLQRQARALTRNDSVALRAGWNAPTGVFGPLHYLFQSRATLEDAFRDLVHYSSFLSAYSRYSSSEWGRTIRLVKRPDLDPRLLGEDSSIFCFAVLLSSIGRITGGVGRPLAVRFQRESPDRTAEYHDTFGCQVEFGAERDEVIFDRSTLRLSLTTADLSLCPVLETYLQQSLAEGGCEKISIRVMRELARAFAHAEGSSANIEAVAKRLLLSVRTMQRLLAKEATTFDHLSEKLKRYLAAYYLRVSGYSLKETAFRLGYSDASAFTRAFRRWYGTSPGNYRAM